MTPYQQDFPNVFQAILLVVGLFVTEVLIGSALRDARTTLGISLDAVDALTVFAANGVVFSIAMRLSGISYSKLFHPSRSSVAAATMLLVVPTLALVPAALLTMSAAIEMLVAVVPLSRWEEVMFARFSSGSLPIVISICVLAPILEEMLFRGLILRGLLFKYDRWYAIWLSALFFGAAHFNLYQFVVGLMFGILLGWLYERSRSLIPCICLHGAYNTVLTTLDTGPSADSLAEILYRSWEAWAVAIPLAVLGGWALMFLLRPAQKEKGERDGTAP